MIRRTFDPSFLNEVVNHPEVRPWVKGEGILDVSAAVLNPANYVLQSEFGGFILMPHEPGRYEVHSQFLPGHGTHALKSMFAAQEWMFTRTDCRSIVSQVPHDNSRAKGLAVAGGLRTVFSCSGSERVELTLIDWAMRTKALHSYGERFHNALLAAKTASGSELPVHEDEASHDRAVGAAFLMITRGQPEKGVAFYNQWARMAGYAVISLVSLAPVIIDVMDAIVGLGDEGMEVLLCR